MRYIKQFMQKTVSEENAEIFDLKMNAIYEEASKYGKSPDVHYHDGNLLCATVRFWREETIPETLADEYELMGDIRYCSECPYYIMPKDKRIKYIKCNKINLRVAASDRACDHYYKLLKEAFDEGAKQKQISGA